MSRLAGELIAQQARTGGMRTAGSQPVRCGKKGFGWYKIRTFALLDKSKKAFCECEFDVSSNAWGALSL